MSESQTPNLTDDQAFRSLLNGIGELQSLACDIGIERREKQSSIYQEECDRSVVDGNEEETLKIIKQTTDLARLAMVLLVRGLQTCATHASNKAKCFSSYTSGISYLREQQGLYAPPKNLLLLWERNVILIDLFTSDERLYCNKRIAQDMFDICLETYDWLRSLANNNK
ncbi:unnamed protein product [Adineta ricciae]|uniref:Uncharacterized protein n=1 Tax=Adineta ricciae TaxID=249248 RepID=A0A815JQI5_ADIRI|nr:unnamed protein product [Adineta ricciae]